ncbi:MAG: hypothetical protein ACOYM3_17125 [Terrimicrobiaceae bacterium]
MKETYPRLKMNADAIISQIQKLPTDQEGREWALELGTAEGKHVRYSANVSPLWTILEAITALHQGGEMPFKYAGILRLPDGPSFSNTFDGQQIFPFGSRNQITEAHEIERQVQQSIEGLSIQEEPQKIEIF